MRLLRIIQSMLGLQQDSKLSTRVQKLNYKKYQNKYYETNKMCKIKEITLLVFSVFIFSQMHAQTDADAIMMNKNQLCSGPAYSYSTWDHYWEGTLHRINQNIGTVTTQSAMYMAVYGITAMLLNMKPCLQKLPS